MAKYQTKRTWCAAAGLAISLGSVFPMLSANPAQDAQEWDEFTVFIEIDGTDEDAGIKGLLKGPMWNAARVSDPENESIYRLFPDFELTALGTNTVFWESPEPPFEDFSLDEFLDEFPAGEYTARGRTVDGRELFGTAELTHNLPAAPSITSHANGQVVELTGENLVICWDPVTEDYRGGLLGSEIVAYIMTVSFETEILGETVELHLTVEIEPDTFTAEIPSDFLQPNTVVQVEVAAREESLNQTSMEIFITVVNEVP